MTPSIERKLVGEIRGNFIVESYQRRYRWEADDVMRLLDDISSTGGKDYSLQPIVVMPIIDANHRDNNKWELIDGQQRLTTLYLIFLYMQKRGWRRSAPPYSINYKTRPDSAVYLRTLNPEERNKNIDYFHLFSAYEQIGEWFAKKGDDYAQEVEGNTLFTYLNKSVAVIWYQAPANTIPNDLFRTLNVGRIALTDAELVTALLLSTLSAVHPTLVTETAVQWNVIERDLHAPALWSFVAGMDLDEERDRYDTRIALLLDTLAPGPKARSSGVKRPRFYTFETLRPSIKTEPRRFWREVQDLHALIQGWFGAPNIYNRIGYLTSTGLHLGELVTLAKEQSKSHFVSLLTELICRKIDISESTLRDLHFERHKHQIYLVLLLVNVGNSSRAQPPQRFPFELHPSTDVWSIEHIHAQNAESLNTLNQWRAWLEIHKKALAAINHNQTLAEEIDSALQSTVHDRNFGPIFHNLSVRVLQAFDTRHDSASTHDIHSISNLALLDIKHNIQLSNAVFEAKRQVILEIDKNGGYIPSYTRNVFLKYFSNADVQQMHFWSPQDRESYLDAIVGILQGGDFKFLRSEESDI